VSGYTHHDLEDAFLGRLHAWCGSLAKCLGGGSLTNVTFSNLRQVELFESWTSPFYSVEVAIGSKLNGER